MSHNDIPNLAQNISAVERETGLSKDVLRMWERRYGFPKPARDENGERQYSAADMAKLRSIKRLMDVGVRPGKIIGLSLEEIKAALSGMLAPERKENVLGLVEVRQVFRISKIGTVAGCYVQEGLVRRNAQVRVLRASVVIHTGEIEALKRFKDDVREVKAGFECGISVRGFQDLKVGDQFEVFEVMEVARTL